MKLLSNKYVLVVAFLACSTGLIKATEPEFSPEVKKTLSNVKAVFSNLDNKISWQCFTRALWTLIDKDKKRSSAGQESIFKNDTRFAEFQAVLPAVARSNNPLFIANKLEKFKYIISGMSLSQLSNILEKRIAYNSNDPIVKNQPQCGCEKITQEFEANVVSAESKKEL